LQLGSRLCILPIMSTSDIQEMQRKIAEGRRQIVGEMPLSAASDLMQTLIGAEYKGRIETKRDELVEAVSSYRDRLHQLGSLITQSNLVAVEGHGWMNQAFNNTTEEDAGLRAASAQLTEKTTTMADQNTFMNDQIILALDRLDQVDDILGDINDALLNGMKTVKEGITLQDSIGRTADTFLQTD
jgi:hypothetical protein